MKKVDLLFWIQHLVIRDGYNLDQVLDELNSLSRLEKNENIICESTIYKILLELQNNNKSEVCVELAH